ncbi:hypothetical protein J2752_000995 [Halarchaeum rubridurum]|uniref:Uncharacterized protein n=1 Tax=Halarchaeum rubridurum TaxID=489911 RepID=A0A8T4GQA7_9EURY|nr:hypothetical protein [Halarchaeum rubridurum]MBP1954114.1 hypothetical protein [Halarchaeum rubridurum]
MRRRLRLLAAASLLVCSSLLARARRRAAAVPLSPVTADGYVGPDFPERAGLTTGETPVGEMDDMAHYARADFDPDRVHPAVRAFYEVTSDYRMTATATWHRGFRLGAALAARATSTVEQLNLPGPREASTVPLESRFATVRADADPRDDVRAWVRTNPETDEAVFVALYGSHAGAGGDADAEGEHDADDAEPDGPTGSRTATERYVNDAARGAAGSRTATERYVNDAEPDGPTGSRTATERYVNVAVPIPWGNVSTALHIAHAGGDPDATGVDLTTRAGDLAGLYLVTPLGAFALPVEQRFAVRPAETGITATQTMWLCGVPFLTIEYEAVRDDDSDE